MPHLGIFGLEFEKTIIMFEISTLCVTAKFRKKKHKCLNLGPKRPYLGTFGQEFEKTIVIFEISTLKFV